MTSAQRDQVTEAVLAWKRDPRKDLTTPEALSAAHAELTDEICRTYIPKDPEAKKRNFTSLASKALWLCYPDSVPIFDGYARYAIYVLSKLQGGIALRPETEPEYSQFVHVWKQLYAKHRDTLESLDIGSYPYRVRVFDRTLWLIGRPSYRVEWTSRPSA